MTSPKRAWRGRRSSRGFGRTDIDYQDALSDWSHGAKLDLLEEGDASWRGDPLAHMFGCRPFNGGQERVLELAEEDGITELGYGGAVGGGKTQAMIFVMFLFMLKYPGWQHWWARKFEKGMGPSCMEAIRVGCDWLLRNHGLEYKETKQEVHEIVLFTGPDSSRWSRVRFMGLDNFEVFQGANFDGVMIDEASQMGREHYVKALERRRGSINRHVAMEERGEKWRSPWLGWTANAKQGYINQEFIVRDAKGQLGRPPYENRALVRARTKENTLIQPDYVKSLLNADPGSAMEARLEGEWEFEEGYVYHESDIHPGTFCRFDPEEVAGKPLAEIVGDGGYDYGWGHPCAWLWGFVHEGIYWVSEELVGPRKSLEEQARWAQRFNRQTAWWADQSTQTMIRRSAETAIMDEFAGLGVMLRPANTGATNREVTLGVGRVRSALKRGVVRIDEARCPMLKRAIMEWQFAVDKRGGLLPDTYSEPLKDENDAFRYVLLNVENKLRWSSGRPSGGAGAGDVPPSAPAGNWLEGKVREMVLSNTAGGGSFSRRGRY